jgi:hypothetical protein
MGFSSQTDFKPGYYLTSGKCIAMKALFQIERYAIPFLLLSGLYLSMVVLHQKWKVVI